ncbi:MAG: ATP-binding protein [Candidatus Latescibacterota bacterium]|jgi:signal transduction histidine kinase
MDAEGEEALVRLAAESIQLELAGRVVGNMAHIINNALTRVLGYVQLMAQEEDAKQREHYLEQMVQGERETSVSARQLLDFARSLRAPHGAMRFNEVVSSAMALVERSMQEQKVLLIEDYDETVAVFHGRSGQVQLLVLHLVLNSLEAFARRGGGGVIQVRTSPVGGKVRLEVEDDGPGLDAAELTSVFKVGFSRKDGGAGLGLPACRAIAEAHGGYLLLSSAREGVHAVAELGGLS